MPGQSPRPRAGDPGVRMSLRTRPGAPVQSHWRAVMESEQDGRGCRSRGKRRAPRNHQQGYTHAGANTAAPANCHIDPCPGISRLSMTLTFRISILKAKAFRFFAFNHRLLLWSKFLRNLREGRWRVANLESRLDEGFGLIALVCV
jgi:hypothetical protein